jgi:hypothetical protein
VNARSAHAVAGYDSKCVRQIALILAADSFCPFPTGHDIKQFVGGVVPATQVSERK